MFCTMHILNLKHNNSPLHGGAQGRDGNETKKEKGKGKRMKRIVTTLSLLLCINAYATTETINWYVESSVRDTTTCTIGGDVTLPNAPTKRGYNFDGWDFGYDFSTLDYTENTQGASFDSGKSTWWMQFSYGRIYGDTICASNGGTANTAGVPNVSTNTASNVKCWCRVTGIKLPDEDITRVPLRTLPWVSLRANGYSSASGCTTNCKTWCAFGGSANGTYGMNKTPAARRAAYGITN